MTQGPVRCRPTRPNQRTGFAQRHSSVATRIFGPRILPRDPLAIEGEFGDGLFVVANMAWHFKSDPETALACVNSSLDVCQGHADGGGGSADWSSGGRRDEPEQAFPFGSQVKVRLSCRGRRTFLPLPAFLLGEGHGGAVPPARGEGQTFAPVCLLMSAHPSNSSLVRASRRLRDGPIVDVAPAWMVRRTKCCVNAISLRKWGHPTDQ